MNSSPIFSSQPRYLSFSSPLSLPSAKKISLFALSCFATWGAFANLPLYSAAAVSAILWTALGAFALSSYRAHRSLRRGEPSAPEPGTTPPTPLAPANLLITELRNNPLFRQGQNPSHSAPLRTAAPAPALQRHHAVGSSTPRANRENRLSELSDSPGSAEKTTQPAPLAVTQEHHAVGTSTLHFGSSPGNSDRESLSVPFDSPGSAEKMGPAPITFSQAHHPVGPSSSSPLRRRLSFSPSSLIGSETPPSKENGPSAPIQEITSAARQLFSAEVLPHTAASSAPLHHRVGLALEESPSSPRQFSGSPDSASPTPQRERPPEHPLPSPIARFGTALQLISLPSSQQVFSPPTPKRGDTAPPTPNGCAAHASSSKPISVASSQNHHTVGSSPLSPEFLISPFSGAAQTTSAPVVPSGSSAARASLKPVPATRYGSIKRGKQGGAAAKAKPLPVSAAPTHHRVGGSSSPVDLPPLSPNSIPSPVGTDASTSHGSSSSSSSSAYGTLPPNWSSVVSDLGPPPPPARNHPPLPPRSVLQALANGAARYPVGINKGVNPA